ncbi:hypothetical protein BJ912DRAFT_60762 [Pholiota molesta]|nr:hypothetical protein BJ912DRAFT_60762 [Pholiota molesta]
MDESMLFSMIQDAEMEEEESADEQARQNALILAALVAGVEEARQARIDRRNKNRVYLCRPQLLPNPQLDTPWQKLYQTQNDRAFITTMGFDVNTFNYIVANGFGERWRTEPIRRTDNINTSGNPRPNARSLDTWGALGLILHYLNSTMREVSLQQIFALIPSTVSRYITHGLILLLQTLRKMPEASIRWPHDVSSFEINSELIVARHPALSGAFGSIDGLNLPVQTSADDDIENATYNGWKADHFISSVLVFAPQGQIYFTNPC